MARILQKIFSLTLFPICVFLVISFMINKGAFAQSNVWPSYLTIPDSSEEGEETQINDSNWFKFRNAASWYEKAIESNTIDWRVETDKYSFSQQSQYVLKLDNREIREHIFSLPGNIMRKNVLVPSGKLGVEWVPRLNYKVRKDTSTYHSTIDVGPIAEAKMFTMPIKVRTGVSTDVWNEAIVGNSIFSIFKEHSWDAGYYLEGELGDFSKPILNMPLYFNLRASGRSIRDAGLGLIMGNMLYTNDLGSGDSIVMYLSDSLSNGKESYLNQGTKFTTTPWRILHNFTASSGLKFAERFGFSPSGYYCFNLRTLKYPAGTELYNDVKSLDHTTGLQLTTQNRYFFNYNGGIALGWSNQDWMYKNKDIPDRIIMPDPTDSLLFVAASKARSLATANNKDNLAFTARMDHEISIPLLWRFILLYNFKISRESRQYSNYYLYIVNGSVDTIRNQLESDGVDKLHHLEISRKDSGIVQGGIYCDYGKVLLYNLRKEASAMSGVRKTLKMGGFVTFELGKLYLNEDMYLQGSKWDYVFKKFHMAPNSRPDQQRDFYSMLTGTWAFNEKVKLLSSWNERFGDDGKWYGKEYMITTDSVYNYYAIQDKKNEYTITMQLSVTLSKLNVCIGGSFKDTYKQSYGKDTKDNVPVFDYFPVKEGYYYIPFVEFETGLRGFYIKGKVKRNFNTIDPLRWDTYKNWDMSLLIQKEW
jgi:hypothetical protein